MDSGFLGFVAIALLLVIVVAALIQSPRGSTSTESGLRMKNYLSVVLAALLAVPLLAVTEENPEKFEFRKAVAIYHLMNNGAVIYVRPDEYDENQGFIRIYEGLQQYLAELDTLHGDALLSPGSDSIFDEFLFVNSNVQKKYFLKSGWLGDGDRWVPMSEDDYRKVKSMIDERAGLEGALTRADRLADFTARIREIDQETPADDFDEKFNRSYPATGGSKGVEDKSTSLDKGGADGVAVSLKLPPAGSEVKEVEGKRPETAVENRPASTQEAPKDVVNESNNAPTKNESGGIQSWMWASSVILLVFIFGGFLYLRREH